MTNRYAVDRNFIGPPMGWIGAMAVLMGHPSILNRYVHARAMGGATVHIVGIGERTDTKNLEHP